MDEQTKRARRRAKLPHLQFKKNGYMYTERCMFWNDDKPVMIYQLTDESGRVATWEIDQLIYRNHTEFRGVSYPERWVMPSNEMFAIQTFGKTAHNWRRVCDIVKQHFGRVLPDVPPDFDKRRVQLFA